MMREGKLYNYMIWSGKLHSYSMMRVESSTDILLHGKLHNYDLGWEPPQL
jgi:hypothetical protein